MTRRVGTVLSGRWMFLLLFLFPILSCTPIREIIHPATVTPTPTATPTLTPTTTPTPTPVPLAQRDLRHIVLQKSDLADPKGYVEIDVPDFEQMFEDLVATIPSSTSMFDNLEKGYMVYFYSAADKSFYINLLLVYADEESADTAYEDFAKTGSGEDVPRIGDDSVGMDTSSSYTAVYTLVWKYQEAVALLMYQGEDDIGLDELVRIAQNIQGRMEG
jgi:hypothetical protein